FNSTISANDFQVSGKLYEAFRNFAAAEKNNGLTAVNVDSLSDYARTRLREELATANYSNEAGVQVLLENDPQVAKAIEAIPEAARALQNVAYSRKSE